MKDIWSLKLTAFLHDPPDKAIKIREHELRRDQTLFEPLGLTINNIVEKADQIASSMQRINIFKDIEGIIIDFTSSKKTNNPIFRHTLSAKDEKLVINETISTIGYDKVLIDKRLDISKFKESVSKKTYLSIWRFLPEQEELYWNLPADTRIPDHTIWDHLDVTSALSTTIESGTSLLSFKIGPVQNFIENAGKTSDLWAGSHLLSYLVFSGALIIVDKLGPDNIIFPYLRGQPFLDFWLEKEGIKIDGSYREKIEVSNIPHRFLAIIPSNKAMDLAKEVDENVKKSWKEIAEFIKNKFIEENTETDEFFNEIWIRQLENTFHITTMTLDWPSLNDENAIETWLRNIKNNLPVNLWEKYDKWLDQYRKNSGYRMNAGSLYGLYFELVGVLTDQKSRLFENFEEPEEEGGEKGGRCNLCGIRNPLRNKEESPKEFWDNLRECIKNKKYRGIIKPRDRLCAVCTIKRFYGKYFREKFEREEVKIPSVATIATRKFRIKCLAEKDLINEFLKAYNDMIGEKIGEKFDNFEDIDGEWFYKESYTREYIKRNYEKEIEDNSLKIVITRLEKLYKYYGEGVITEPPKYYAILAMDGDKMGEKLRGENLPPLKYFLHPTIVSKLEKHIEYKDFLSFSRLFNPNTHMAISRALKDFSVHIVGDVIKNYHGFLIYSGGDDVLALLPADEAVKAAKKINNIFGKDFHESNGKKIMLLGGKSEIYKGTTMSAGIVFTHYKYPLYETLSKAREARDTAKEKYDRNAFVLTHIKHSGQIDSVGGKWDIVKDIISLNKLIGNKKLASRFIYSLIETAPIIENLEDDGKKAQLKYLLLRHWSKNEENNKKEEGVQKTIENIMKIYNIYNTPKRIKNIESLTEIGVILKILYNISGDNE